MSDLPARLRADVHMACDNPAEPCAICRNTLEAADYIEQLEAAVVPPAIRSVAFMAKTMVEGDRPVGQNVVMTLALWCLGELEP